MGKVIRLPVITRLDLDPDSILEELKGKLNGFVLLGYDKNDEEFFSSTYADGGDCLWLVERFKKMLIDV